MRGFQEEISPPSGETWWILESSEKNSQQLREMDILDSLPLPYSQNQRQLPIFNFPLVHLWQEEWIETVAEEEKNHRHL